MADLGRLMDCSGDLRVAILLEAMASYRELLSQTKAEIAEIDAASARARAERSVERPIIVDVRERDEWEEGIVPGAHHIPRGFLESQIDQIAPERDSELIVYCAGGARSAFAAKSLQDLGYTNVVSLAGGFAEWKRAGYDWVAPTTLSADQRSRYSRHLLIPEVGEEGQLKLLDLARASDRRGVGSARLRRSTSRRPVSERLASSTPTRSTPRICSDRSSMRRRTSANRRSSRRERRSRPSTPMST